MDIKKKKKIKEIFKEDFFVEDLFKENLFKEETPPSPPIIRMGRFFDSSEIPFVIDSDYSSFDKDYSYPEYFQRERENLNRQEGREQDYFSWQQGYRRSLGDQRDYFYDGQAKTVEPLEYFQKPQPQGFFEEQQQAEFFPERQTSYFQEPEAPLEYFEQKREKQRRQEHFQNEPAEGFWEKRKKAQEQKKYLLQSAPKKKVVPKKSNNSSSFNFSDFFFPGRFSVGFNFKQASFKFASLSLGMFVLVFGSLFVSKGIQMKAKVLGVSDSAYQNLNGAIDGLKSKDFSVSVENFKKAQEDFSEASKSVDEVGGMLTGASRYIPYASKLSSGKNLVEAGKHIAVAGENLSEVAGVLYEMKEGKDGRNFKDKSMLDVLSETDGSLKIARKEISVAKDNLAKVKIDDVPKEKRNEVISAKEKIGAFSEILDKLVDNNYILADLLGGNGPRKYLFLFQNNNEMRSTGGFIGSYGLIDISNGKINKFFIDGIFNPDGQLVEKIVPPTPIQKISAAWSLHDSNWFPDFPTSAKKAMLFYERTGGATVDGVVTFTPAVMQKLLEITGPIYMEEYGTTVDSKNFVEKVQYEVEEGYDVKENKPKKILADLAPIVMEKLMNSEDVFVVARMMGAFDELLRERHILVYSSNNDLQKIVEEMGWSGEVLENSMDYISVINTNINGYKTDGVVDESINHEAQIMNDGRIVDTVTIRRKHNGGDLAYDWWNRVNADYMRVYVPKGSKLLSVEGQTREVDSPPLNYDALGFERDPDVSSEESSISIDEDSGTRVYEDSGKTVFANWVYVSPREEVVVKYQYELPFRMSIDEEKIVDSYSLLAQKQSGSAGSSFVSKVKYPKIWKTEWKTGEIQEDVQGSTLNFSGDLKTDKFLGAVFSKR